MTATVKDLFCGAGGSSLGAEYAGAELVMAANHWQTAIDVHQAHFPDAGHDCADISQADPRRYPRTDILLASPECTNHSQARGVSRRRQDPTLWDAPDPTAERSRATMWDVVRFAEQMNYTAIVVENVVEATKWVLWPAWIQAMTDLGYTHKILSHNSMHHGVPQSRDRIYIVWTRKGIRPDLEFEQTGWCPRCTTARPVRQAFKNGRTVGRYGPQWVWSCTTCHTEATTATAPAASIIDWTLECPRIGDRTRPLADKTRQRIYAGLQRFGWAPVTTSGAGNVHERTPGNRSRPITEPLPTQQTTATTAIATPPDAFAMNTAHGGRHHDLNDPHPTVCAADDRLSLVVRLRGSATTQLDTSCSPTSDPVSTVAANGNHLGLVVANNANNVPRPTSDPLATVTTGNRHALLMRNNTGGSEMTTPVTEPARTVTTAGHQSLLIPYNKNARARDPHTEPMPTVTTVDGAGLVDVDQIIDDCGFRMLEPFEVAAAMAFPTGYIPRDLTKKAQVKLAGNAVTPPVMAWIVGRILQALETAA
jgi:DNA (cytosine-5)-methyltransferase 1